MLAERFSPEKERFPQCFEKMLMIAFDVRMTWFLNVFFETFPSDESNDCKVKEEFDGGLICCEQPTESHLLMNIISWFK